MKRSVPLAATLALCLLAVPGVAGAQAFGGVHSLAVTLKLRNQPELQRLIQLQSNPRSGLYGHFLTTAQFRAEFAPTPLDYGRTIAALRASGLAITRTFANNMVIDVTGSSTAIAHAFATRPTMMLTTRGPRSVMETRPINPGMFPAIDRIVGLNQSAQAETSYAARLPRGGSNIRTLSQRVGPDGGFGPKALFAINNYPNLHGNTGVGVTMADIIDGPPNPSDLATFLSYFGVTDTGGTTTIVPIDGGNGFDTIQPDVDFEWMEAAAPAAATMDYEVPFLGNTEIVDAFTQAVSDNKADVINFSVQACNVADVDLDLAIIPVIQEAAAQGQAIESVAFGGAACGYGYEAGIDAAPTPADSADLIGVGGSSVITTSGGKLAAQSASPSGGSGVSLLVPIFPEQKAIKGTDPVGRNVPDIVTAAAINGAGPSFYSSGFWQGGIVFVNNAPVVGAMADLQQKAGHRLGALDVTIYNLLLAKGYGSIFSDVQVGCNGVIQGVPVCAKTGFDHSTGIGSVNFNQLGNAL